MSIQLLTRPGLADDEKLLHQLQLWMNERYEQEVANNPYLCKRVQFKPANAFARRSSMMNYAWATGKVTHAFFCLDDKELFRYEVILDFTGEKVSGVCKDDFFLSNVTDEQIEQETRRRLEAAEKLKANVTITDREGKVVLDAPIVAWSMTRRGPTQTRGNGEPQQRVRIIDASRFPQFFLAEGFIFQTHVGGAEPHYGVRLDSGQTLTVYEKELFFL